MAAAYGFGMYGMFGHAADPVNFERFCQRVKGIGVDIQGSPYRDFDMQTIVNAIMRLPEDAVAFVFGASLGANDSPVVVHALNHHRKARRNHRPRLLPLGGSESGGDQARHHRDERPASWRW